MGLARVIGGAFACAISTLAQGQTAVETTRLDLTATYEPYFISSGDNFPSVDLRRDSLVLVEVALHRRMSPGDIGRILSWSDSVVLARLRTLEGAGLAHRDRGIWRARAMVITPADTGKYIAVDARLVANTVSAIRNRLTAIQSSAAALRSFDNISFDDASLLILSDVLLDAWQIHTVENRLLLGHVRPLRNGKRYYVAVEASHRGDVGEPFGIYGNACCWNIGGVVLAMYGNQRNSSSLSVAPRNAVADTTLLSKLAVVRDGRFTVPYLDSADYGALQRIADAFSDTLVALLRSVRPRLAMAYRKSPYASEVSFDEYFMWWYHFYYSAVTEELIAQGVIKTPPARTILYAMTRAF